MRIISDLTGDTGLCLLPSTTEEKQSLFEVLWGGEKARECPVGPHLIHLHRFSSPTIMGTQVVGAHTMVSTYRHKPTSLDGARTDHSSQRPCEGLEKRGQCQHKAQERGPGKQPLSIIRISWAAWCRVCLGAFANPSHSNTPTEAPGYKPQASIREDGISNPLVSL